MCKSQGRGRYKGEESQCFARPDETREGDNSTTGRGDRCCDVSARRGKELLAVVAVVRHFRHYLCGFLFTMRIDYVALQWLLTIIEPEGQVVCWIEQFQPFTFTIHDRAGARHANADILSRWLRCTDGCSRFPRREARVEELMGQDEEWAPQQRTRIQTSSPPPVAGGPRKTPLGGSGASFHSHMSPVVPVGGTERSKVADGGPPSSEGSSAEGVP
ncbi:Retrovirus-related Pol polyprotein from transposon 17.6 [Acipenser ruthenus]|uniref:Retrovirus-related Pol polyprotein from transposon 17.6 n=1 Tax=Acipenser ruthenus TaxID=7906 RepID=A0A444U5G3_ACIRT|nr:Retrovirus-related Pol polyprotein from transposon 17.6 [Acipenser ruthenus]